MPAGTQLGGLIGKGGNAVGGVDSTIQIWGLWHYAMSTFALGTVVSVQLVGVDIGDFNVATDGSVTVPLFGTTVAGVAGIVTMAQLLQADEVFNIESNCPISIKNGGPSLLINVPVVIGRAYLSQGQRLRAVTQADLQDSAGAAVGTLRRTHQFAALVQDAVLASFGTTLTPANSPPSTNGNMISQQFYSGGVFGGADPNSTALPSGTSTVGSMSGFSGVVRQTLTANDDYDDMFCWQVDRPYPFVMNSVTCFLQENRGG